MGLPTSLSFLVRLERVYGHADRTVRLSTASNVLFDRLEHVGRVTSFPSILTEKHHSTTREEPSTKKATMLASYARMLWKTEDTQANGSGSYLARLNAGPKRTCLGSFALFGLQQNMRAERSLERVCSTPTAGGLNAINSRCAAADSGSVRFILCPSGETGRVPEESVTPARAAIISPHPSRSRIERRRSGWRRRRGRGCPGRTRRFPGRREECGRRRAGPGPIPGRDCPRTIRCRP